MARRKKTKAKISEYNRRAYQKLRRDPVKYAAFLKQKRPRQLKWWHDNKHRL